MSIFSTARIRGDSGSGVAGVSSLNGLTGVVTLSAGANITLTPVGNDIEIAATGGGGSPAAPQYSVQFNNPLGTFDGDANFTFNPTTGEFNVLRTDGAFGGQSFYLTEFLGNIPAAIMETADGTGFGRISAADLSGIGGSPYAVILESDDGSSSSDLNIVHDEVSMTSANAAGTIFSEIILNNDQLTYQSDDSVSGINVNIGADAGDGNFRIQSKEPGVLEQRITLQNRNFARLMEFKSIDTANDLESSLEFIVGGEARLYQTDPIGATFYSEVGLSSNGVTFEFLGADAYTFPIGDGTLDQVMATNGAGQISWVDVSSITPTPTLTATQVAFGSVGNTMTSSADMTFNDTNDCLTVDGIDICSPTNFSTVVGGGNAGNIANMVGQSNSIFAYDAGSSLTNGARNTILGEGAANTATLMSDSVIIGRNTGTDILEGGFHVIVGSVAGGGIVNGTNDIFIGFGNVNSSDVTNTIAIGSGVEALSDNTFYLGSESFPIFDGFFGGGELSSTPTDFVFHGTGGDGTDEDGGILTFAGGRATGSGIGGDLVNQTSVPLATGTTLQTLGDRGRVIAQYTNLTEATPTGIVRIQVPNNTVSGGTIVYTIEANDGTDFQSLSGVITYDIVNKAGTATVTVGNVENPAGEASSSGTLVINAVDHSAAGGVVDIRLDVTSSLTQSVLRVSSQVIKNYGTGLIVPL